MSANQDRRNGTEPVASVTAFARRTCQRVHTMSCPAAMVKERWCPDVLAGGALIGRCSGVATRTRSRFKSARPVFQPNPCSNRRCPSSPGVFRWAMESAALSQADQSGGSCTASPDCRVERLFGGRSDLGRPMVSEEGSEPVERRFRAEDRVRDRRGAARRPVDIVGARSRCFAR